MAEKKKNALVPILIILVVVLLAAAGVIITLLVTGKEETPSGPKYTSEFGIGYEINASVITSDVEPTSSQGRGVAVRYRQSADSTNGWDFNCEIGNSTANALDMYLALYEAGEDIYSQEPVYVSGLLRPGEGITHFKTNREMPKGSYDVVAAFTLVEDDHKTLYAQSLVYLTFRVE